jgi:hypothetical protein
MSYLKISVDLLASGQLSQPSLHWIVVSFLLLLLFEQGVVNVAHDGFGDRFIG